MHWLVVLAEDRVNTNERALGQNWDDMLVYPLQI